MPYEKKPFIARKTTWAALLTILTAAAGYAAGHIAAPDALTMAFNAIMALGLRSAIAAK